MDIQKQIQMELQTFSTALKQNLQEKKTLKGTYKACFFRPKTYLLLSAEKSSLGKKNERVA